jgi:hypothetical protein
MRGVVVALCVLALVGGLGGGTTWWVCTSDECPDIRRADLSLRTMGDVKKRVENHSRAPDEALRLSGEEASFVLADYLRYPVWLEARADELEVQLLVPVWGRCALVDYSGQVEVDDGRATLRPTGARVGGIDVSLFVVGRELVVDAERVTGPHARDLLTKTQRLRVVGNEIVLTMSGTVGL